MNFKFSLISVLIFVLIFTACTKKSETQQQTATAAQTQITDTEEDFSAGFDPSYLLDGDLWFTAADTGLKGTFATQIAAQEILNQYENYVAFIDDISPEEYKIIFTSTHAIDLEFLAVRMDYNEAKNELSLDVVKSIVSAIVRPDRPFVVNWEPQLEFPHRAVAFYDRNNIKRYFPISGNATSEGFRMHLNEWRASPPQEAQQYSAQDLIHLWRFESGSHLLFFQGNMTVEFVTTGSVVRVYHVNEGWNYNLIYEGTWSLTNGNNLFIEGEKGLGGGTPGYSFTFIITGDILTITDHVGNTAVFRRLEFQG
ncbi:MAG: hypothetical protein LBH16_02930 [Treponema sp.]|jgi:hypothetical protein|nr:hypothetical protein [Treponema sp.]